MTQWLSQKRAKDVRTITWMPGVIFLRVFRAIEKLGGRPVARIDGGGGGGCGTPKSGPSGLKKWTFLNLTPLPSYKNPNFGPLLWLKVDLLADLGVRIPPPPGYGPAWGKVEEYPFGDEEVIVTTTKNFLKIKFSA